MRCVDSSGREERIKKTIAGSGDYVELSLRGRYRNDSFCNARDFFS